MTIRDLFTKLGLDKSTTNIIISLKNESDILMSGLITDDYMRLFIYEKVQYFSYDYETNYLIVDL